METNFFKKGMRDAPGRYQNAIRNKIKRVLGIKSNVQFRNRQNGKVHHTQAERLAIEAIFKEYGVNTPWGKE